MVLEMITGGVLVGLGSLFGFLAGRFAPARRKAPKPPKPVCGCDHELAFHDPATGECRGTVDVDLYRGGCWIGQEPTRCTCRQYDGPTPLPVVYAPQVTG